MRFRLIFPAQSKGRTGKTTTSLALANLCDHRGVPWSGFDLDEEHRSFSARHPGQVSLRGAATRRPRS